MTAQTRHSHCVYFGDHVHRYQSGVCKCGAEKRHILHVKPCKWCGRPFQMTVRTQECCKRSCANELRKYKGELQTSSVCRNCGESYVRRHSLGSKQKDNGGQLYCSRCCAAAVRFAEVFCRDWFTKPTQPSWRECKRCGNAFLLKDRPGGLYCSTECRIEDQYKPRELTSGTCARCGKSFLRTAGAMFCSTRCRRIAHKGDHAARARKRGLPYEHINSVKVFERDNWICQICGEKTDKTLIGTRHDLAPELDHITALCLSGSSTYDNVQCTCRKCNREKGRDEHRQWCDSKLSRPKLSRPKLSRADAMLAAQAKARALVAIAQRNYGRGM
jgi:hypothetical protein